MLILLFFLTMKANGWSLKKDFKYSFQIKHSSNGPAFEFPVKKLIILSKMNGSCTHLVLTKMWFESKVGLQIISDIKHTIGATFKFSFNFLSSFCRPGKL